MNTSQLRQLQIELAAIAEELGAEICAAEKGRDAFVSMLYHSRRKFTEAAQSGAFNSTHLVNRQVDYSYSKARAAGFRGSRQERLQLLLLRL